MLTESQRIVLETLYLLIVLGLGIVVPSGSSTDYKRVSNLVLSFDLQGISLLNRRHAGASSPDTKRYMATQGIFSGIRSMEMKPAESGGLASRGRRDELQ